MAVTPLPALAASRGYTLRRIDRAIPGMALRERWLLVELGAAFTDDASARAWLEKQAVKKPMQARYWIRVHHMDVRARMMADRHYSRRTPGAPEFIPAGHKIVLLHFASDGTPAALWASHRPAPSAHLARPRFDGLDVWDCSIFRIEQRTVEASTLIREAVAITRGIWPELPSDGFYTTIDPRHVAPIKRRGNDVWGYSYIKAGWKVLPERTKTRKLVQLMLPHDDLAATVPIEARWEVEQLELWELAA